MSADNYALIGPHPHMEGYYWVYFGSASVEQPERMPMGAVTFSSLEEAQECADAAETEYGIRYTKDCFSSEKESKPEEQIADWERELLYSEDTSTPLGEPDHTPERKTLQQMVQYYSDVIDEIVSNETHVSYTWKGVLYEFLSEIGKLEFDDE